MKFLFHFYDLQKRAGIQRAICELANALVAHGDSVVMATHSVRTEVAYRLDDRVIVEQTPYAEPQMFGPWAWPVRMLWGLRQGWVLHQIVKRYRPDLIVDHGTALGLLYPFRKFGGVPFVMQRHFPARNFPRGIVLYRLLSLVCGRKLVVVLTESIAKDMVSLGYKHVVVIPNIIPADARPSSYQDAIPKTALLMGRSSPEKGFDIFLRALAMIEMHGWHFSIIGPNCNSDLLMQKLVQENGLGSQVSLLPTTNDPFQYIRAAACVIMPSRYESFGLVALEALSIGRPVIASDADGPRDLVIDNVNGLIFPCNDVSGLSKCLERVRNHPTLLERLASQTFLSIKPFNASLIVDKWEKLATLLCGGLTVDKHI